jgi:hypothetical protein
MKSHGSDQVDRRWCSIRTNLVCGCFDNSEGLNNEHFPSRLVPLVRELANSLRLGTAVLSQDLSAAWVTVRR